MPVEVVGSSSDLNLFITTSNTNHSSDVRTQDLETTAGATIIRMRRLSTILVLVLVISVSAQDDDEEKCDDFECPVKGSYESLDDTGCDSSLFQMEVLQTPAPVGGTTPA